MKWKTLLKLFYNYSLNYSILLLNGVHQKGWFLSMLLGTLGATLLRNILAGKGIAKAGYGIKNGKGIVRAGHENKMDF